jgi:hypothetical protein
MLVLLSSLLWAVQLKHSSLTNREKFSVLFTMTVKTEYVITYANKIQHEKTEYKQTKHLILNIFSVAYSTKFGLDWIFSNLVNKNHKHIPLRHHPVHQTSHDSWIHLLHNMQLIQPSSDFKLENNPLQEIHPALTQSSPGDWRGSLCSYIFLIPSHYLLSTFSSFATPHSQCTLLSTFSSVLWSSGQSSWPQNGDTSILCFLWGTNWVYIRYIEESRPPLWSSGQSSWLQIQRFGFDSWRYQIFWEEVGLERGPLSLVSTTEELLGSKRTGSGLESREYGSRDPSRWAHGTLYTQKLALTSPIRGGRSVGIVRSRTQVTEFSEFNESDQFTLIRWTGEYSHFCALPVTFSCLRPSFIRGYCLILIWWRPKCY